MGMVAENRQYNCVKIDIDEGFLTVMVKSSSTLIVCMEYIADKNLEKITGTLKKIEKGILQLIDEESLKEELIKKMKTFNLGLILTQTG